jgi:type VI secretion system protein ImpA
MDLTVLAAPLPGDAPFGPDMVFSSEFDAIKEQRRADDASLSQGEWVTEIKRADWPAVKRECGRLLGERTKDLRLAAWWTEAALQVDGYAGLADGLALYTELCRNCWDGVHPAPEDGDQELRIGSVTWLLSLVRSQVRNVPFLGQAPLLLTIAQIEAARQRPVAPEGSEAQAESDPRATEGKPPVITRDTVARAQRVTAAPKMMAALEALRRVPTALASLQQVVDEKLGDEGPGFAPAREAVQAALLGVERLARDMGLLRGEVAADAPPADKQAVAAQPGAGMAGLGAPVSRAQALAQLRLVAEYFRRTEPHSPVAYLAERAAHWGEMPLHEWLRAVLKEQGALSQLEDLLGVQPPTQTPEG